MNDILNYNTLIDSLPVTPMFHHLSYTLTYTPCDTLTDCLTYTLTYSLYSIPQPMNDILTYTVYHNEFPNGYSNAVPLFRIFSSMLTFSTFFCKKLKHWENIISKQKEL